MRLKNKVCIITGIGSGIGQAGALLFAKEGAKVVGADVNAETGAQTVKQIKDAGGEAVFCRTDVSKSADVERLVKTAVDAYGRLDVLYNNAAIFHTQDHFLEEISEEVWDNTMTVNLKGVFLCCKHALPALRKGGGGAIVNTASTAAMRASERPTYATSKGGVVALTLTMARLYAKDHIRVNVICPGPTDTPMSRRSWDTGKAATLVFPQMATLLERRAQPVEIAEAALFLASDAASFITGAVLNVDGGSSAR